MHKQKEFRLFNILNIVSHCTKRCGALYLTLSTIVLNIEDKFINTFFIGLFSCLKPKSAFVVVLSEPLV